MSLLDVQSFFYWCMILNLGFFTFSAVMIMALRSFVCKMHARLFGLTEEQVSVVVYSYLGAYKIVVIAFNIVPWLALCLISPH